MVNFVDEYGFDKFDKEITKYINFLDTRFDNEKDVTIVFMNNDTIQQLNLEFRTLNKPTDVLSFDGDDEYLGDIIISVDKVKDQAQEYNHSIKRELFFLITHAYLHLQGYDHVEYDMEQEMFKLQKELLDEYGIKRESK